MWMSLTGHLSPFMNQMQMPLKRWLQGTPFTRLPRLLKTCQSLSLSCKGKPEAVMMSDVRGSHVCLSDYHDIASAMRSNLLEHTQLEGYVGYDTMQANFCGCAWGLSHLS